MDVGRTGVASAAELADTLRQDELGLRKRRQPAEALAPEPDATPEPAPADGAETASAGTTSQGPGRVLTTAELSDLAGLPDSTGPAVLAEPPVADAAAPTPVATDAGPVFVAPVARPDTAAVQLVAPPAGPRAESAKKKLAALDGLESRRFDRPRTSSEDQARRILHLPPGAAVDGPVLDALHALVGRAEAAGRARTMGELAAFHLRQPGVLEGLGVSAADRERHFTRDGNRIPGLNGWTRQVAELDTSQADIVRLAADGTMQGIDLHQRVPWDGDAYVVLPGERSGAMTLRLPDESVWELSVEELAEVVARDLEREGLAKDVPIVLPRSVPGGQIMVLAALLAHRTGHRVWMHAAQVGLSTRSGVLQLIQQDGRDKGDWKELPPGAPAWYADVDLRPTVSERTGRQNGVMSFTPKTWPACGSPSAAGWTRYGRSSTSTPRRMSGPTSSRCRAPVRKTKRTMRTCTACRARRSWRCGTGANAPSAGRSWTAGPAGSAACSPTCSAPCPAMRVPPSTPPRRQATGAWGRPPRRRTSSTRCGTSPRGSDGPTRRGRRSTSPNAATAGS